MVMISIRMSHSSSYARLIHAGFAGTVGSVGRLCVATTVAAAVACMNLLLPLLPGFVVIGVLIFGCIVVFVFHARILLRMSVAI